MQHIGLDGFSLFSLFFFLLPVHVIMLDARERESERDTHGERAAVDRRVLYNYRQRCNTWAQTVNEIRKIEKIVLCTKATKATTPKLKTNWICLCKRFYFYLLQKQPKAERCHPIHSQDWWHFLFLRNNATWIYRIRNDIILFSLSLFLYAVLGVHCFSIFLNWSVRNGKEIFLLNCDLTSLLHAFYQIVPRCMG